MPVKTRSDRDDERRQRRIRIVVSLFMLFILVFSSVAYFFTPDPNAFTYEGTRFRVQLDANGFPQGYVAKVDGVQRTFFSRPTDGLYLTLPEGFPESLEGASVIVILFDPEDNLTPLYDAFRFELERTLEGKVIVPAVTEPSALYPFPTYTCAQATGDSPVLRLTQGPIGITATDDGCVTISGGQYDFAVLLDRIRYRLLGVTEQ